MSKKKENKIRKFFRKFFSSYSPLIVLLLIINIILISYCNYLLKSTKVFTFSGSSDYVSIYNGVLSLNYDINLLEGSDITYLPEKDIIVSDYKIGYYVKDGDNLISIAVKEDSDEEGLSLKAVLEGKGAFNVIELNTNNFHFNKERIALLKNGLYFVIEATDMKGNTLTDIINLSITKITK